MKWSFSLKDLFFTVTFISVLIGLVLACREFIRVERIRYRVQVQYLLAINKINLLEEILDKEQPDWRVRHSIPPKLDDLPPPEPLVAPISAAP